MHKIVTIALIFTLVGVFLQINLSYPFNTSLRVPMEIDKDKAVKVIEHFESKNDIATPWGEDKCQLLSERITEELQLESLGQDTNLSYGATSYIRERWVSTHLKPKVKKERRRQSMDELIGQREDAYWGSSFIRINYLFFLNEGDYLKLSESLRKELKRNVILVKNLHGSTIDHNNLSSYTASTIVAMFNSDIAKKRVVDFGAGDGILSLVAVKLGASSVVLVDKKNKELKKAKANLEFNGLKHGDYHIIRGDLNNTKKMKELFKKIPWPEKEIVVLSNIGSSRGWYKGTTNLTSITLIPIVEKIANSKAVTFIAGGCTKEDLIESELETEKTFLGFQNFSAVPEKAMDFSSFAWIAKRDVAPIEPDEEIKDDPRDRVSFVQLVGKSPRIIDIGTGNAAFLFKVREILPKAKLYGTNLEVEDELKNKALKQDINLFIGQIGTRYGDRTDAEKKTQRALRSAQTQA